MLLKPVFRIALLSLLLIMIGGGCMVGPDYERPKTPLDPNNGYNWLPEGWTDTNDPNASVRWWEKLGDPFINEVVEDVLVNNTDLLALTARMEQAEAIVRQVYGLRWPEVSYSAQGSRTRQGMDISFFPGGDFVSFYSTGFNHGFNVTYVTDLFGRLKRTHRAAIRDLQAYKADRVALAHSMVAMAVDLRVQMATAQKLLAISENTVSTWEQSVEVIERRYEGGLGSPVDLYLGKERLAAARAETSVFNETIVIVKHALDVMRGCPPQGKEKIEYQMAALPPLTPVPMGLPSQLLQRRPDVQAAELRVASAIERIGAKEAERYPDLAINLGFGFNSNEFEKLLDWKYRTLLAAAQLSAPIFAGGRLKAGVDAAKAEARASVQEYVGKVLVAVQEVEDNLMKGQTLTEQLTHYMDQHQQASEADRLSRDRYVRGVDTLLVVLESERRRRQAEMLIATTEGSLWRNRISLYLSLGGDWGLTGYGY